MIKLGIAIPAYGSQLDVGHAAMWLGLGAALATAQDKFKLHWMSEYHINGIDLCRNVAVYDAMKAGCDWVFMIDADTFHRSTGSGGVCDAVADAGVDIIQMIRDADRGQTVVIDEESREGVLQPIKMPPNNGVGLVGAPYRGRNVGSKGVLVYSRRDPREAYTQVPLDEIVGKVQPVGRIGGGCIAVNCGWLRHYWPQGPWFEMQHDYSERPYNVCGEDYFICDGIYKRGGTVLCDGRFVPAHVDRRRLVGEP
jgi:hypothetical protein